MGIKRFSALLLTIGLVLALTAGFATTTLAAETKKDASKADWKFHDIVNVDFVLSQKGSNPRLTFIHITRPADTFFGILLKGNS